MPLSFNFFKYGRHNKHTHTHNIIESKGLLCICCCFFCCVSVLKEQFIIVMLMYYLLLFQCFLLRRQFICFCVCSFFSLLKQQEKNKISLPYSLHIFSYGCHNFWPICVILLLFLLLSRLLFTIKSWFLWPDCLIDWNLHIILQGTFSFIMYR